MPFQLAQLNIAVMVAPLDDPRLAGFVAGLEPLNALADASPGFLWRLQSDDGDATAIRFDANPMLLVNMSVWESLESLRAFVYGEQHRDFLRERRRWFEAPNGPHLVLWWVPAGHRPDLDEARERLMALREHGPGAWAFDLRNPFPPPDD